MTGVTESNTKKVVDKQDCRGSVRAIMQEIKLDDVMPKYARGERQGNAKLTDEAVRQIRKLHKEGAAILRLARAFGVTAPTIRAVLDGKTWKHVE